MRNRAPGMSYRIFALGPGHGGRTLDGIDRGQDAGKHGDPEDIGLPQGQCHDAIEEEKRGTKERSSMERRGRPQPVARKHRCRRHDICVVQGGEEMERRK